MTPHRSRLASVDEVVYLRFRKYVNDGSLIVVEGSGDLPFPIARVFYIQGVSVGGVRGDHAHINCKQVLVSAHGKCEVICDDGTRKATFELSSPDQAVYVPPPIWAFERFLTPGAVLVVFADVRYDETDYIRDYSEFQRYRREER